MASALGSYEYAGEADGGKALSAATADFAVSAVIALLLWPFPLVRLTLGFPWAVHGPLIALWVLLVYTLYLGLSALAWGRSPAMYFLDLGLAGPPRPFGFTAAFAWASGWTVALLPAAIGARRLADPRDGLPARFSGLSTVAAAPQKA